MIVGGGCTGTTISCVDGDDDINGGGGGGLAMTNDVVDAFGGMAKEVATDRFSS